MITYRITGRFHDILFDYSNYDYDIEEENEFNLLRYKYPNISFNYLVTGYLLIELCNKYPITIKPNLDFNWTLTRDGETVLVSDPMIYNSVVLPGSFVKPREASFIREDFLQSSYLTGGSSSRKELILNGLGNIPRVGYGIIPNELSSGYGPHRKYILYDDTFGPFCYVRKRINILHHSSTYKVDYFMGNYIFNLGRGLLRSNGELKNIINQAEEIPYTGNGAFTYPRGSIGAGYDVYFFL